MKLKNDFSNIAKFEKKIKQRGFMYLWEGFQQQAATEISYKDMEIWQIRFAIYGLKFEYGLDCEAYNFELSKI